MEDTAERIVNRAINLGCQDAVADVAVNRSYQIRFAQNQVVISNRWRETTASAFIVYKKRVVASDIKDLTKLEAQVENLVKIAKASQENPDYAGIAKGPFESIVLERTLRNPRVVRVLLGGRREDREGLPGEPG